MTTNSESKAHLAAMTIYMAGVKTGVFEVISGDEPVVGRETLLEKMREAEVRASGLMRNQHFLKFAVEEIQQSLNAAHDIVADKEA